MRSVIRTSLGPLLITLAVTSPADSQWRNFTENDEMTGELSSFAHSPQVAATEGMPFPYTDTRAWLGFGCDAMNEWAYIGFSSAPNLTDDETEDGYNRIKTRIRWDDQVETVELRQDWGSSFIHFTGYRAAIQEMEAASSVLVELQWYSVGRTYFRFPLAGSSQAIAQARSACGREAPEDILGTVPQSQARIVGDASVKIYFPIRAGCWRTRIRDENRVFFRSEGDAVAAGLREPRISC